MAFVHPDRQKRAINQGAQCIIDLIEREKAQVAEKAREQYVEIERRFCLSQSILEKEREASQNRINDLVFWNDKKVLKMEKAREDDKAKARQKYDALERDFSQFREDVTKKDALRSQELAETSEKYTLIKDELDRTLVKLLQSINEAKEARMQAAKADQDLFKVKSNLEKLHIFHNDNNLAFGHCWAFILAAIDDPTASQFSPETVQVALGKLEKQLGRKTYANEFRAAQAERDKLAKELDIAKRELQEASATASSSAASTLKLQMEASQSRTSLEAKEAELLAAQAEREKLIQDLATIKRELEEVSASTSISAVELLNLKTEASDAKTKFESQLVVANSERDNSAQELVILKCELKDASSTASSAAAATLKFQAESWKTIIDLEATQTELVVYRAERDKLAQDLATTKSELTKAMDDAASFAGDTLQLQAEVSASRAEFTSKLAVVHAERDRLAQNLVIIKRELKEAHAAASFAAADSRLLTEASRALEDQLRRAQGDRDKLTRELAAAKPKLDKVDSALSASRIQTQKLQKNILELKIALGSKEAELQAEKDKSARDLVDFKLQLEDSLAATSTSVVDALKLRKEAIQIQQEFDALAASIKETLTSCKIECDLLDDGKISYRVGISALKARIDYLSTKRKTLTKWKTATTADMHILEKRLEENASVFETSETKLSQLFPTSSSTSDSQPTISNGLTSISPLMSGQHSSTNPEALSASSLGSVASSSKQPNPSTVPRTKQPTSLGK